MRPHEPRWMNDYGDIPIWYWLPRYVLMLQTACNPRRWQRRNGRSALWTAMALMVFA